MTDKEKKTTQAMGEPLMGKLPFGAITDLNKEITDFFKLGLKILYRKIQNQPR
ncbi:MAG: hypothetical protein ACK47N_05740 [Microcystis sp.]|jgi:hypothetical protein|uniref:hypothetical protein n=1 Tax=Microcystis TaxID=1125 RepID=UPI001681B419|nr:MULTISPECIES: hypothetical protein [Microcystis]NCQ91450.1 hypothetical protein [Microcystis aeruginosa LG13-13]NCR04658.1 hypothetical protein [Microcystis aeruginosa LG13-03]NCR62904.1 hypothetical protein [Microcystis aeruginosa LG11-05]NCR71496.1 hypothetical protein [Microcystis aeruginosa LG13-12]MBD2291857.1 hypothetical protein [Microcystis wesenbergii FACHB-1317]